MLFLESDAGAREARWMFLGFTVLGTVALYWVFIRLKVVTLEGTDFVISNYFKTIRVSAREVERVSGSILVTPELVWLHFRQPTEFGSRVVFMPKQRFLSGFTRHPLVQELKDFLRSPDVVGADIGA